MHLYSVDEASTSKSVSQSVSQSVSPSVRQSVSRLVTSASGPLCAVEKRSFNSQVELELFSAYKRLVGKNRIEDSRFFQNLKKRAFPFFSPGHFEQVEPIYGPNGTTNETYKSKTLASPGCPQKISMIYLLWFRRYMHRNK